MLSTSLYVPIRTDILFAGLIELDEAEMHCELHATLRPRLLRTKFAAVSVSLTILSVTT